MTVLRQGRVLAVGLLAALFAADGVAATTVTVVDAGGVLVEADLASPEHCTIPSDLGGLCSVAWEDGGTPLPGDDRVVVAKHVRDARVRAPDPVSGGAAASLDLRDILLEHQGFVLLNHTAIRANDTLPAEAKRVITLESRSRRVEEDGAWRETGEWGVFVVAHTPVPVATMGEPRDWVTVLMLCWDICYLQGRPYLETDETRVRPFPYGVLLDDGADSDYYVSRDVEEATECWFGHGLPPMACQALDDARPTASRAVGLYQSLAPNVHVGFGFRRASLELSAPSSQPAAGAGAPEASADGARSGEGRAGGEPPDATPRAALAPGSDAQGSTGLAPTSASLAASGRAVAAPPGADGARAVLFGALAAASALVLAAWALYHRISHARVLEQGTRKRVYDLVLQEPGIRIGSLAARLGLDYKSVQRHVLLLEKMGFVRGLGEGQKHYFAAGSVAPAQAQLLTHVLATPAARSVYEYLAAREGADLATVGQALGLAPSTVSGSTSRLRAAGLVRTERQGRRVVARALRAAGEAGPVPVSNPSTLQPASV